MIGRRMIELEVNHGQSDLPNFLSCLPIGIKMLRPGRYGGRHKEQQTTHKALASLSHDLFLSELSRRGVKNEVSETGLVFKAGTKSSNLVVESPDPPPSAPFPIG